MDRGALDVRRAAPPAPPVAPRACGRRCGPTAACCSAPATAGSARSPCPYYWLFELFAPLLEVFGIIVVLLGLALGIVNIPYAILFLVLAYGLAILVTLAAMSVEEWAFHRYTRWRDLAATVAAAGPGELRLPTAHRLLAACRAGGRACGGRSRCGVS